LFDSVILNNRIYKLNPYKIAHVSIVKPSSNKKNLIYMIETY